MWSLKSNVEIVPPKEIAKAVKYMASSYEGELEATKIATEYAPDNISLSNDILHLFSISQQD